LKCEKRNGKQEHARKRGDLTPSTTEQRLWKQRFREDVGRTGERVQASNSSANDSSLRFMGLFRVVLRFFQDAGEEFANSQSDSSPDATTKLKY